MGDLVKKYMEGELKVDEFITHRKSLGGVNEAFAVMKVRSSSLDDTCSFCQSGDCIRCVVDMRTL
jgi:S-(hydroxymethyl)glutathione dehydrogenase / alcohol dehydrogenase